MRPGEVAIGKLAKDAGVSTATINFYVKEGVLPPPRRLNRTRAAYSAHHVRLLRLIKNMQAAGLTLTNIKSSLEHYATHETGLRKLEDIGLFHAPRVLRIHAEMERVEPFTPMAQAEFAKTAGVDREFLRRIEAWGVLRPAQRNRYDVRDLAVVRALKSLTEAVPLDDLRFLENLAPFARGAGTVVDALVRHHRAKLRTRELRFRDLLEPFGTIAEYMVARVHHSEHPTWTDQIVSDAPRKKKKR